MSIEHELSRIATALEKTAEMLESTSLLLEKLGSPLQSVKFAPPTPGRGAEDNALVATNEDPFAPGATVLTTGTGAAPAKRGRPAGPAKTTAAPVAAVANPAFENAVTKDEVQGKLRDYVRKLGNELGPIKGKELLAQYGAGRVSELDPKHFPKVFAFLEAELKK